MEPSGGAIAGAAIFTHPSSSKLAVPTDSHTALYPCRPSSKRAAESEDEEEGGPSQQQPKRLRMEVEDVEAEDAGAPGNDQRRATVGSGGGHLGGGGSDADDRDVVTQDRIALQRAKMRAKVAAAAKMAPSMGGMRRGPAVGAAAAKAAAVVQAAPSGSQRTGGPAARKGRMSGMMARWVRLSGGWC